MTKQQTFTHSRDPISIGQNIFGECVNLRIIFDKDVAACHKAGVLGELRARLLWPKVGPTNNEVAVRRPF